MIAFNGPQGLSRQLFQIGSNKWIGPGTGEG